MTSHTKVDRLKNIISTVFHKKEYPMLSHNLLIREKYNFAEKKKFCKTKTKTQPD